MDLFFWVIGGGKGELAKGFLQKVSPGASPFAAFRCLQSRAVTWGWDVPHLAQTPL